MTRPSLKKFEVVKHYKHAEIYTFSLFQSLDPRKSSGFSLTFNLEESNFLVNSTNISLK